MSGLPAGWERTRLADVADVRLGRQRSPKNASGERMRPYLRAANVKWQGLDFADVKQMAFSAAESETYELRPGDLLVGEASGSPSEVGKPGQYRGEVAGCCFQNTLLRVRLPAGLLPNFYEHFFREQALNGRFAAGSRGVGIRHLGAAALSDWTVPVPPTAEQVRIVTAIDEAFSKLDAGEAGLRTVRQLLNRMREAVLAAAVTGDVRSAFGAGVDPWAVWTRCSLGELVQNGRKVAYGVLQPGRDTVDGVPMVRVMDLADGSIAVSRLKRIASAVAARYPRTSLRGGEVLLSVVGTIGRTAVVPSALAGANVARAIAVLPLDGTAVLPEWVVTVLRWEPSRRALESAAHEVARKTLNLEDVRRFEIPVPPPAEQASVVAEVDRQFSFIAAAERAVDAGLARSAALRRSVLNAAFEGRLGTQDPSDEPAAVLVERIRADCQPVSRPSKQGGKHRRDTPSLPSGA